MKKKFPLLTTALALALTFTLGCEEKSTDKTAGGGALTDSRDGKKYKTVKIGNQTWMAVNLNYQTESGSWCYGDDKSNCDKYGRLYDWNTARTVCPDGWKLPSRDEWTELFKVASPAADGKELKSASGWDDRISADDNGRVYKNNGTDNYGFSALPGGYRTYSDGSFSNAGGGGSWWTATEKSNDNAYYMEITWNYGADEGGGGKGNGFSVRCVKK